MRHRLRPPGGVLAVWLMTFPASALELERSEGPPPVAGCDAGLQQLKERLE